ncbi:hypothetical protein DIE00_25190 [Burkholderia sp. Bp8989]|nr:hypothetical protein DIE05_37080 [Burkholderia sp. Bp8995]RQS42904.1 hypothetical protein DIE00_25190 [Burkholderia sp. Bp8989]
MRDARSALRVARCALCVVRCALCVVRCALCVVRYALCVVRGAMPCRATSIARNGTCFIGNSLARGEPRVATSQVDLGCNASFALPKPVRTRFTGFVDQRATVRHAHAGLSFDAIARIVGPCCPIPSTSSASFANRPLSLM